MPIYILIRLCKYIPCLSFYSFPVFFCRYSVCIYKISRLKLTSNSRRVFCNCSQKLSKKICRMTGSYEASSPRICIWIVMCFVLQRMPLQERYRGRVICNEMAAFPHRRVGRPKLPGSLKTIRLREFVFNHWRGRKHSLGFGERTDSEFAEFLLHRRWVPDCICI